MKSAQPILLDCTRMVTRFCSGATPTGIDRVADAYRAHFRERAQAVIQVRGRAQVLSWAHSERLFALFDTSGDALRQRVTALGRGFAALLVNDQSEAAPPPGALYLNVTHTGFDLDRHIAWVQSRNLRPVYLLHDLIPIEHPQFTTPRKVARHNGRVRRALEAANGIIANSCATANAITAFARAEGLTVPPLLGAPLGSPALPLPSDVAAAPRPYFVCVSTIEQRKNHMLLLDVWQRLIARLGENAPRLMLIGRWGVGSQAVRRRYLSDPQLRRFVTIRTGCTDAEVVQHLRSARALLAPSRAEGFGLPLVEALTLGVPVIASDLPVFREVGGTVPSFLGPDEPDVWFRTIQDFLADGLERKRQLDALATWSPPDWRDHFAQVDDWLQTLPKRRSMAAAPLVADNDIVPLSALTSGLA
jgi:glycosyltransferase involved in cell wall biosynthesis